MILGIEEIYRRLSLKRFLTDSHGRLKSKSSDDIPFRNVIDRFKRIAAVHNPGQKTSVKGLQQFLKEK